MPRGWKRITAPSSGRRHIREIPFIDGEYLAGAPTATVVDPAQTLRIQHGASEDEGAAFTALEALPPPQDELGLHVALPHVNEVETPQLPLKKEEEANELPVPWTAP